ncbi:MAG: leucine-rich repeat domain-containing protein [Clostridia bacterium]|nr:leucine-rich repeat domain-containing protein [Clostridia bacterium]
MKRIVCILMVVMLLLCCVACGNNTDDPTTPSNNNGTQSSETTGDNKNPNNDNQGNSGNVTLDAVLGAKASPESDFEITDYGDVVEVSKYLGDDEIVVIPETINGKKVTRIGAYVFANDYHPNTKAVKLSDGITTVSTSAFGLNAVLEIFVAGSGLVEIGEGSFQNCSSLSTVVLNEGVKTLGSACFSSCAKLEEIEIPSSVTEIHRLAFYYAAENFTIVGVTGSAAETYANEQQITFRAK